MVAPGGDPGAGAIVVEVVDELVLAGGAVVVELPGWPGTVGLVGPGFGSLVEVVEAGAVVVVAGAVVVVELVGMVTWARTERVPAVRMAAMVQAAKMRG